MKIQQTKPQELNGKPYRIGILVARYNDHIGGELLANVRETLLKLGVLEKNIEVCQVPGALEMPLVAQKILKIKKFDALITLGAVIKGDTAHFDYVCQESYRGLMDVSLASGVPIVFGVLTVYTEKQALERSSKNIMNKGREYAETAVEMATLMNGFSKKA